MIGNRIRELRRAEYMTQKDLSEILGVSASAVGMYEQDRRTPDIETLQVICERFNVPADFLLFGKGGEDAPISVDAFLKEFRAKTDKLKGLLYDQLPDGGRRPLCDAEVDKLYEFVCAGASTTRNKLRGLD
ncbi:hypothetical protein FACS1894217_09570 [Clostridia bacterium]|nr:hypothetical protein FACS1894217_09570 [Clostridia bacterium]